MSIFNRLRSFFYVFAPAVVLISAIATVVDKSETLFHLFKWTTEAEALPLPCDADLKTQWDIVKGANSCQGFQRFLNTFPDVLTAAHDGGCLIPPIARDQYAELTCDSPPPPVTASAVGDHRPGVRQQASHDPAPVVVQRHIKISAVRSAVSPPVDELSAPLGAQSRVTIIPAPVFGDVALTPASTNSVRIFSPITAPPDYFETQQVRIDQGVAGEMLQTALAYNNRQDPEQAAHWLMRSLRAWGFSAREMLHNKMSFSSNTLRALQQELRAAGVYNGPINGVMTEETNLAVDVVYGQAGH